MSEIKLIFEDFFAGVGQVIAGMKFVSFLKNDARHGIDSSVLIVYRDAISGIVL